MTLRGSQELSALRGSVARLFLTYVSAGDVMRVVELLEDPTFSVESVFEIASPLHVAVTKRDYAMFQLLLEKGFDPNIVDSTDGGTILHRAAALDEAGFIRLGISSGCATNMVDARGMTALHVAAYWGSFNAAKALLDMGAIPDTLDGQCKAPRYWAEQRGHADIAALLPPFKYDWQKAAKQSTVGLNRFKVTKMPKKHKKKKAKRR